MMRYRSFSNGMDLFIRKNPYVSYYYDVVYDVIVIGGGQSGLAMGYYLRKTDLSFLIVDRETEAGGSWQHHWKSLRLFSPAQWSSLPGVIMPGGGNYYPTLAETVQYLRDYEHKYQFPVKRPVKVIQVEKRQDDLFYLKTSQGSYRTRTLVNATGSFYHPLVPEYPGMKEFQGEIIHSSAYQYPEQFKGKRVAVIGEGNSGAQILAEVSRTAQTIWVTRRPPRFLPEHVDGRYLFDAATQMYEARKQGKSFQPPSLGDIVMVPPVREARERGVYSNSFRPFTRFVPKGLVWADGHLEEVNAAIFCTGFRPSLEHLAKMGMVNDSGTSDTIEETRSSWVRGMWFVGYGNWTGFASATLIGVGRSARATVEQIKNYVSESESLSTK